MKSILPAILSAVLLSACSSVSVKDYQHSGKVAKPQHVYVAPFDTTRTSVNIGSDKNGTKTTAFKQAVTTLLHDYTVQNVTKHVAPASKVAPLPFSLVRVCFTSVTRVTRVQPGAT